MKLVVGDRVGIYVGTFFDSYAAYSSMSCILVTFMGHRTKRFFQWSGKMGERF